MCIIVYKKEGLSLPSKQTLKNCFNNNSDGCGFMYVANNKVNIKKGYFKFKTFYKDLLDVVKKYGDKVPMVLHFRITTQGGVKQHLCHPYPLSEDMKDLKKLNTNCDIGVAHNGIISLTTSYQKDIDYNDTMLFITDYLSLIIDKKMDYYKNAKTLKLIEKLIGSSRLAILDKNGHCELIGSGWVKDNGIYYSNSTYKEKTYSSFDKWGYGYYDYYDYGYDDDYDKEYALFKNNNGTYDFDDTYCPLMNFGDDTYCEKCTYKKHCSAYKTYMGDYYDYNDKDDEGGVN